MSLEVTSLRNSEIAPALLVSEQELLGAQLSELVRELQKGIGRLADGDDPGQKPATLAIALDQSRPRSAGGLRTYLPESAGAGYWDFVQVVPGIFTGITDAHYYRPYRLELPQETVAKIRVVVSGSLSLESEGKLVTSGSALIHSLQHSDGRRFAYEIKPGDLQMVTLHLMPDAMESMGIDSAALHDAITQEPGEKSSGRAIIGKAIEPASTLLKIAEDIIHSRDRLPADLRLTYITGKSRELLTEALTALFYDVAEQRSAKPSRRRRLQRRLHEARRILESTIADPPTIEALARMVGINRTTLKSEFKSAFGCTIHQFHAGLRMSEAKRLIEETELRFGQIAEQLGFQQAAQFSTAVKRHFGRSPRELRAGPR